MEAIETEYKVWGAVSDTITSQRNEYVLCKYDSQVKLDDCTEWDTRNKAHLRSSGCTEVRYCNIILMYKSGLKMIKSAGVREFSSDHALQARSRLTVAYLRAHPPNQNSSNRLQPDQVLVFAVAHDHLYTARSDSMHFFYVYSYRYCIHISLVL